MFVNAKTLIGEFSGYQEAVKFFLVDPGFWKFHLSNERSAFILDFRWHQLFSCSDNSSCLF